MPSNIARKTDQFSTFPVKEQTKPQMEVDHRNSDSEPISNKADVEKKPAESCPFCKKLFCNLIPHLSTAHPFDVDFQDYHWISGGGPAADSREKIKCTIQGCNKPISWDVYPYHCLLRHADVDTDEFLDWVNIAIQNISVESVRKSRKPPSSVSVDGVELEIPEPPHLISASGNLHHDVGESSNGTRIEKGKFVVKPAAVQATAVVGGVEKKFKRPPGRPPGPKKEHSPKQKLTDASTSMIDNGTSSSDSKHDRLSKFNRPRGRPPGQKGKKGVKLTDPHHLRAKNHTGRDRLVKWIQENSEGSSSMDWILPSGVASRVFNLANVFGAINQLEKLGYHGVFLQVKDGAVHFSCGKN